jgi:pyochelin biosynthetic protein PchC
MWIRRLRDVCDDVPAQLVCFPHAGGSASYFYSMAGALQPDVAVLAIQYPGREDRYAEPPIDDIGRLADRIAVEVKPHLRSGTVFFGHSMGAILAFEVALRLEQGGGLGPAALIASGRRAPSRQRDDRVHLRDDDGLLDEVRRLGGTRSALLADPDVRNLVLPAIRSDYRAIETYRCSDPAVLDCPVFVFVGDADPMVTLAEAWAWERHSSAEVEVRVFPGGHFYLAERGDEVVENIRQVLKASL